MIQQPLNNQMGGHQMMPNSQVGSMQSMPGQNDYDNSNMG